jgi:hypothetical protein
MSNSRIVAILSEKYPIIKVPESIYNPEIYLEKPERPSPPKEPKPYDFNSSNKKINNFVISAFVFFIFLLFQNIFMIFLGGIISIFTFLIRNDSVNQKQDKLEQKYKEDYKKYKEELDSYKVRVGKYNELKN